MELVTITRSILIPAPRAQIWAAVTEPDQLVQWLLPGLPGARLERDTTGKLVNYLGPMGMDFAQFDLPEPQRRATLRSLPDRLLTVNFDLADDGPATRLTVSLTGLEALPPAARADRAAQTGAAWEQTLQNLAAVVAGAPLPFPQAFVSPLFGFWREPQQQIATERSIWIKSPRARVWQALVDPQLIQQWFSPTTPWELSDLAVGGRMYVVDPETKAELYTTIIEALDPPSALVLRHPSETPGAGDKRTEYTLTDENGGTRLTLLYLGYERDDADARWMAMEQTTFGYGMMLQNLQAVVEGRDLPFPGGF